MYLKSIMDFLKLRKMVEERGALSSPDCGSLHGGNDFWGEGHHYLA